MITHEQQLKRLEIATAMMPLAVDFARDEVAKCGLGTDEMNYALTCRAKFAFEMADALIRESGIFAEQTK